MSISKLQVEAYYYGNPRLIADRILFIKRVAMLGKYKEHLTNIHGFGNAWQGVTGQYHGQQITMIATGIGPSMVGDAVYALSRPDSLCLYSGTCGGLDKKLEIGDFFVADHAITGDGFTFQLGHPPLAEISGDPRSLELIKSLIAIRGNHVEHGTAFTTDSVVRETDGDFWQTVPDKCQIIEMAAAAFYAAADASGKKAAAYFWVSDLPARGKSFFDVLGSDDVRIKQDRYDRSVSLALDLISSL
jgi:purine-nucleoside phosphorylase